MSHRILWSLTWHIYNQESGKCECYQFNDEDDIIKCGDNGITMLQYGQCVTHDEKSGSTEVAKCPYFHQTGHNISEVAQGYITLPSNVSELNEHMCGPMNRRGLLCSDCVDGFEFSATSVLFTCSNCTHFSLTYGIPLYLLIEVIPITILKRSPKANTCCTLRLHISGVSSVFDYYHSGLH